jgi:uncharacterized membrane protein YeaQ/YmgE (transglycosylase-associated protein family)
MESEAGMQTAVARPAGGTMNAALWVLAGAALGWIGFAYLRVNRYRGLVVSIIIGAVGGFFGGNVLAPLMGAAANAPGILNVLSLVVASASAVGCLAVGNFLDERFDV